MRLLPCRLGVGLTGITYHIRRRHCERFGFYLYPSSYTDMYRWCTILMSIGYWLLRFKIIITPFTIILKISTLKDLNASRQTFLGAIAVYVSLVQNNTWQTYLQLECKMKCLIKTIFFPSFIANKTMRHFLKKLIFLFLFHFGYQFYF